MAFNPKRLIPIVVIVGLTFGGFAIDRQRAAKQSSLTGIFEAQPTKVSSRLGGRVAKIKVKEGDVVKKGQVLVECEADAAASESEALGALATQANWKADLVRAGARKEEIMRQEAVVAELQATLKRLTNGNRPEEIAIARKAVEQAQARYDLLVKGPKDEDIASARAAEQTALARLQQAERGLTPQERSQVQARYDSAHAGAVAARRDADRERSLVQEGASSQRSFEAAEAHALQAEALEREAKQALERAQLGTPREELNEARKAHDQALAQYRSVAIGSRPEDVRAAKAALESTQQNFSLVLHGARSEDIVTAKARLAQASATLSQLRNGSRPQEINEARFAARAAENQAQSSDIRLSEKTIYAPVDGVIERVSVADGDLVSPGQLVIQMNDPNDIWLRVYVPEIALAKVKTGDKADLSIDGIEQVVPGLVESIATQGEFTPANLQTPEERGKQVFAIRIRLATVNEKVKAGMAVTVKKLGLWP